MWTWKKTKRLFKSLSYTNRQINKTSYKLRLLRKLAPRPPRSSTPRSATKKMPMNPKYASRMSIRNELNVLKRKVGRNTPAPVYFLERDDLGTFSATAGAYLLTNINCTDDVINRTDFRDNINGDEWYNNYLQLRLLMSSETEIVQVVVYVPNSPTISLSYAPTGDGAVTIPDPAAFRVLSNRTFTRDTLGDDPTTEHYTDKLFEWKVSLRNFKTTYNSNSGVMEKNPIKIMVFSKKGGGTTAVPAGKLGWQICLQDK